MEEVLHSFNQKMDQDRREARERTLNVPLPDGSFVRLPCMPLLPLSDEFDTIVHETRNNP